MLKELFKRRVEVILIISGLIFIFLSFFHYINSGIEPLKKYNSSTLIIGLLIILLGILWAIVPYFIDGFVLGGLFKIKKDRNGTLTAKIERVKGKFHIINVHFGTLTDFNKYNKDTLVVLPANDKFDDECIKDTNSALGAIINKLFPNRIDIAKKHIKEELRKRAIEKFDIGQWVFLDLSKIDQTDYNFKIAFVAVTHLQEDGTIKAYSHNIYLALRGVRVILDTKHISKFYVPLIGSGHGGLSPEVSLLSILLSVIEIIKKDSGHRLEEVNIVVYKKGKNQSSVSSKRVRRILSFVLENSK